MNADVKAMFFQKKDVKTNAPDDQKQVTTSIICLPDSYHSFPMPSHCNLTSKKGSLMAVFGWNPTVWVGDVLVMLSAGCGAVIVFPGILSKAVWGIATIIAVTGQVYAHITSKKTEKNAARPIAATVRSFILWHWAVILTFRED